MGGRYFYINDNGTVWCPGWSPVKTELDSMSAVTVWATLLSKVRKMTSPLITSSFHRIITAESRKMTLTNFEVLLRRNLNSSAFIEWCLRNPGTTPSNFQRNFILVR